jgi:cobalt transport protein ATP-binding subunit
MIKCESLSFSYPGGAKAVDGIDMEVGRGEFVAVMGANGSGKTTLLKLLIGLLKPASGRIFLDGRDSGSLKEDEIFRRVGMVFQDPNDQLFATTVEDDVAFGPSNLGMTGAQVKNAVDSALRGVGIAELRQRAIHTLSFGQKRRATLAGVLAMDPDIILLDEPTGGLDPLGTASIMSLLHSINHGNGPGMLMATHDIDLVPLYCDKIIIMNEGRAVAQGSPRDVLGNPAVLRQASLRLPRLAHLFEIISREDGVPVEGLPLTIGEARQALFRLREEKAPSHARTPGSVK